jgi:hypothetical protein
MNSARIEASSNGNASPDDRPETVLTEGIGLLNQSLAYAPNRREDNEVRQLAAEVCANLRHLEIDYNRLDKVGAILRNHDVKLPKWDWPGIQLSGKGFEETVQYFFSLNSINYCYHQPNAGRGELHYRDGDLPEAALAAARLTQHWDEIKDPRFLAHLSEEYVHDTLFRAEVPISMVPQRTKALRELGEFLTKQVDNPNLFREMFEQQKGHAFQIARSIPTFLESWRDDFFKRAQLNVGMIFGRYQDDTTAPIDMSTIPSLTVYADYIIPQVEMNAKIIIPTSEEMMHHLRERIYMDRGSELVREIRASTVHTVEILGDISGHPPAALDALLWLAGQGRCDPELVKELFEGNERWNFFRCIMTHC